MLLRIAAERLTLWLLLLLALLGGFALFALIATETMHWAIFTRLGDSLLKLAQNSGMPLDGTCVWQMACSTCHVIVAAEWFDRLPHASEEEEDMLDLATGVARTSRLSCQIRLTDALDGLVVQIAEEQM